MSARRTENIPLASSISVYTKKVHIFDGLHSASLISLSQLCDDNCVSILDKNDINISKGKKLILTGHMGKYIWPIRKLKTSEA